MKITIQNAERTFSGDDGNGGDTNIQEAFELFGDLLKGAGYSAEAVQTWFDSAKEVE